MIVVNGGKRGKLKMIEELGVRAIDKRLLEQVVRNGMC